MQDLRLAFRALRATPIVTMVAVLSIGLGIGANTAIFSLVNALILRPLPVSAPERLVTVSSAGSHGGRWAWSYPVWEQIHQRAELFDGVAAWAADQFNLASGGEARFVDGLWANGSFFSTLGVARVAGPHVCRRGRYARRRTGRSGGCHQLRFLAKPFRRRGGCDRSSVGSRRCGVPDHRSNAARFLWPRGRPDI